MLTKLPHYRQQTFCLPLDKLQSLPPKYRKEAINKKHYIKIKKDVMFSAFLLRKKKKKEL